ncbi:MAG: HAMP domain-containing protein [Anaerolineales bacterium]|nr:HAMP domain-containing protein [Anaerolineales bacterium]
MLTRLHNRLLASYAAIVITVLLIVALALFAFTVASRVRLLQPLQQLSAISSGARRELLRAVEAGGDGRALQRVLQDTAAEQRVRILIANAATRQVIFDTDPDQGWLGITIGNLGSAPRLFSSTQPDAIAGSFVHPTTGVEWLVYGRPLSDQSRLIVFYAQRAPTAVAFFRQYFLRPLCGAGLLALLLSVLLAYWIAGTVSRPLRQLAGAATAVSQGQYDQPVTPEGPQEVRQLAASFNQMAAQVQRSQQAQRDFVANVSHDLKTPITSIHGWSQSLLDGTADTPETQQHAAGVIHAEAERMARMVTQLLDLARIESGQFTLVRDLVDLPALLRAALQALAPRAAEAGVQLTHDLPPAPPIAGDPDRLTQVFTNLLDNALTHTPRNGRVHLALAAQADGGVVVSVRDSGKGIPAAELPRVFERFYQVDKARSGARRGAGLGLAIAKEIVAAHGGEIAVHSEEGLGTEFRVRLPKGFRIEATTN